MRPFSPRRPDGSSRLRPEQVAARIAAAKRADAKRNRSKRANGKLFNVDARSSRGRRLTELIAAYSIDHDLKDERTAGLIKTTAAIAIQIEAMEHAIDRGDPIDNFAFARLVNTRERNLSRLREMKAQNRPTVARDPSGWSSALARHLHFMGWVNECRGPTSFAEAINDPAWKVEYERREAAGEFLDAVH
jgi:hypothetical protein